MKLIESIKKLFLTSTAVYIDGGFIDIARADVIFGRINISFLQRFPLSKDIRNLSFSEVAEELDAVLGQAFPDENKRPRRIAVNILNEHLVLRRFTIPDIPKKEIAQAASFEAQRYIPTPIEGLIYGFKSFLRKKGQREIVFIGSDAKSIGNIVNYFTQKDMLPSVIESMPALFARALDLRKKKTGGRAFIFIHYEPPNKAVLCEVTNGYPFFIREIDISDREGLVNIGDFAYPTIKDVWPVIEKNVSSGIDYLGKETSEKIERIIISGFMPSAEDDAAVCKEFGLPFERPRIPFLDKGRIKDGDRYLPVLMLLYDSVKKPFLNIAPEDVLRRDLWGLKSVIFRAAVGFLAVLSAHIVLLGINANKAKKIEAMAGKFGMHAGINIRSSRAEVLDYKNSVTEKVLMVSSLISGRRCLSQKLSALGQALPPDSWIDALDYSHRINQSQPFDMTISGTIFDSSGGASTTANRILEDIKKDSILMEGFKDADLASVQKKDFFGKEVTVFKIIFK